MIIAHGKMGIDKIIQNLERSANPTDDLLRLWSIERESTVEELIEFVREDGMDRDDAATILEDLLRTKISNVSGIVYWNCVVVVELESGLLMVFQFFFDTPVP